ncbi:hypothetical protein AQJ43_31780 [Streptomyces avermitilis]|uniref:DUF2267 domain-containing protein n=1 Tax=Streptomyces avermitilis TaxID=33903 RepID=A0A4D4N5I0_STRAX|nr:MULTISPECIES: DUF2267 domain-containing protein [Streptomyces]KUN50628.1 hypothetical protein AQJ43_31780 [Streptomyces avermitilis]MYS96350.1 DUF2267 domain-containing protein [Streptomyces sp. SID5469]OOV21771.1 hypothetical protein SM007_32920 [Streptomyces avermitilis]BBJ48241.1 hypothetical protein SAVMC3_08700 [Streptomyces avermitilis]GDY79643.1 hypothetical protein SAV31267_091280 [Streptomyces avermitilis]
MTLVSPTAPSAPKTTVTFVQMLEKVRYEGAYPTRRQAQDVLRRVLEALGRQLTGDERVELAARLPREAAGFLASQIPTSQPLTGWGFVKDLAERTGGTLATTRWDTGTVLGVLARLAGDDLTARIIGQLPDGYALLFGRAQLVRAA